ncbi:DUF3906 family protein [Paenibacillus sp. GCM10023252]|uniref:DUF3906 family protein n=1 Tax=Paenibacillus sp. GCM10023252 TaxID=3252649 RepID=UPI003619428A
MFLYKIEIELPDKMAYLILLAENDERAFGAVESHITRHFLKQPDVKSCAIVEKKRTESGSGYIIEGL